MLDSKGDKIEFLRNSHRLIESLLASNIDLDLRPPNINLANSQKWKIDLTALVEVVKKIDFSSDIRFKQSVTGNKSMKRVSSQNTIPISKMNSTHIGMNHASNSDDRDPSLTFNKLMSEDSSMTMSIDGGINVSADYFKTNPPLSSSKKTNKRISINEHEDMQNVGIGTNNYRATPLDKLQEMLFQGSSNNLNRSSSKSKSNVLDNASMDSSRYEDDTF